MTVTVRPPRENHQPLSGLWRFEQGHAKRRGWEVVETYNDAGVSGAKGRDQRPGLDALLKDASRGKFDVVLAWAIDRLGRSLIDLLGTIQHLEVCKVDLYLEPAVHRYDHADGQIGVPGHRRLCGIRALDDQAAGAGRAEKGGGAREGARTTQASCRARTAHSCRAERA
jgi:Resolvase, N terminal domain